MKNDNFERKIIKIINREIYDLNLKMGSLEKKLLTLKKITW